MLGMEHALAVPVLLMISGALIGLFFRAPAILAVSGLILLGTIAAAFSSVATWQDQVLRALVLLGSLQIGYIAGVFVRGTMIR